MRSITSTLSAAFLMATALTATAADFRDANAPIQHVLLVSIDGFHAEDLSRFVAAHPQSTLATLAGHGTTYAEARVPVPSDSFPGILSLVTGGTPKSTGVMYDDSFDPALSPAGSDCKTTGADVVLDEAADVNDNDRNTTLDEKKLPRNPAKGCAPFYPHEYLRVNTIFEVVKAAGGRTAWADKHPAYDLLNGPSGKGIDDLFVPEINADGTTDSVAKTESYDDTHVAAIVKAIAGHDHAGNGSFPAPTLMGLNFQAVSVAQKLPGVGYTDATGTPSAGLEDAIEHTDASLAKLVTALDSAKILGKTLVVITAKHGQSPVDPAARKIVDKKLLAKIIKDAAPGGVTHITEDTAAYIWLKDHKDTDSVVKALTDHSADVGSPKLYSGEAMLAFFNDATKDGRMPDIMIQPVEGVIYSKATATKIAEHGGSLDHDRHVALLVAGPGMTANTVAAPVATTSVAATIITALGLNPEDLQAVKAEGTKPLPVK